MFGFDAPAEQALYLGKSHRLKLIDDAEIKPVRSLKPGTNQFTYDKLVKK